MSGRILQIRLRVFTLWLREYVGVLEKDFCRQIAWRLAKVTAADTIKLQRTGSNGSSLRV
jgi:hypothetical protein